MVRSRSPYRSESNLAGWLTNDDDDDNGSGGGGGDDGDDKDDVTGTVTSFPTPRD